MALKTNLSDDKVTEAAARIQSGETWKAVAAAYGVDRCDLSRHFRLLGLDYRRRFYKCQAPQLIIPDDPLILAYLAGLFDGEGHIGKQSNDKDHPYEAWHIGISNNYRPVIDWLLEMGGKDRLKVRASPKHALGWDWRVHNQQDVLAFLQAIEPYMIIKRDLAREVIEKIGHRPYRRAA